jgi:hypothetical protein
MTDDIKTKKFTSEQMVVIQKRAEAMIDTLGNVIYELQKENLGLRCKLAVAEAGLHIPDSDDEPTEDEDT